MGMVVNNNIPALFSFNAVTKTGNALQKSIQKLSTGLRINSAADDAAGLAISEKMRAQIRGLDRAVSNSQDGISMIQTAEGALNETHSILQRMRELSVQSANDTLTQQDRGYIQLEIDQLREEITRIGNTTQFNKKKLLNGDAAVLWSSDNLNTKAIVNGGLRQIDQFGQKNALEGNFKINIKAEAGQAEVKKTDIFKIKHKDVLMGLSVNREAGVRNARVDNVPAGTYEVKSAATGKVSNVTGQYGFPKIYSTSTITGTANLDGTGTNKIQAANNGQKFQLKIDGVAFGDEVTLATDDTAADIVSKINNAVKNAKKDGFTFKASVNAGGNVVLETYAADSATAKVLSVSDVGAAGAAAAVGLAGAINDQNKAFDLTTALTTTADEAKLTGNASVLFEVMDVNESAKTVKLKATASVLDVNGNNKTTSTEILLSEGTESTVAKELLGDGALKMKLESDMVRLFSKGNKFVYNFSKETGADVAVEVSGRQNKDWDDYWGGSVTRTPVKYGLKADTVQGKDIHFKNFYLNEKSGVAFEGDVTLTTDKDTFTVANVGTNKTLANFDVAFVGQVAKGDVKLRDLEKFWDAQGRFLITDPQTLTITQGSGKQTKITLYANDTLNDVAKKLNEAIGSGLGQNKYVDDANNFATFVDTLAANSESVAGTFVIRSVVAGAAGKLNFAGDEDLVKALSLNVIQSAKETSYTVDIKDAHTDKVVVSGAQTTGNKLIGVLHPNIDVEFDAMAGITATWDKARKAYTYKVDDNYSTVLHLADNTTVFQIGANEGEDMGINIGDMRAHALGLNEVLVTDRESAARSITVIDNAIDKVSTQRAKLGAYQNRLEHTINNLTVAGENLTAAESRIRDTDMAKEMMNFTKLNIMLQAGNAMLAQANQLPQNVLSLIR